MRSPILMGKIEPVESLAGGACKRRDGKRFASRRAKSI
jgi:hypothetical protein